MIRRDNDKITANQAAKLLVWGYGQRAMYWQEKGVIDWTTEKEEEAIDTAVWKQLHRVDKLLGMPAG